MQTGEDARRIRAIGAPADRVEITRNLKYDLPVAAASSAAGTEQRTAFLIPPDLPVVTAGSTHQGEDEVLVSCHRRLNEGGEGALLILVPRHPERAPQVAESLERERIPFTLRSKLCSRTTPFTAGEVLLVDTVGELMTFYTIADAVFVGGSLVPTGGHNILEPASLRKPVVFGPHMGNFREAAGLVLDAGAGIQVRDGEELASVLGGLLADPETGRVMGEKGGVLMEENSGSAALHLKVVERFLPEE